MGGGKIAAASGKSHLSEKRLKAQAPPAFEGSKTLLEASLKKEALGNIDFDLLRVTTRPSVTCTFDGAFPSKLQSEWLVCLDLTGAMPFST